MIKIATDQAIYLLQNGDSFAGLDEQTVLEQKYSEGNFTLVPDYVPINQPDWESLLNRLLSGDLYPLFHAITVSSASNPLILMARGDIYGAISNPAINDRISALRAGLIMLSGSGFAISNDHKDLWNMAIAELNFPSELSL
jgi:hypothetical protein